MARCWASLCCLVLCHGWQEQVSGLEAAVGLLSHVKLRGAAFELVVIIHCGPSAWLCRGPVRGFAGWQRLAHPWFCWSQSVASCQAVSTLAVVVRADLRGAATRRLPNRGWSLFRTGRRHETRASQRWKDLADPESL